MRICVSLALDTAKQAVNEDYKKRQRALSRQHAKRHAPRYRSLLSHWAGLYLKPPRRAKVAPLPQPERAQVAVSYAGHATVLIRYRNLCVLTDPMLGDWRGGIRREVRAGLSPAELDHVDLILLSNQEPDHLHPQTLSRLPKSATVIVPPHTARRVSEFGFARVIELGPDQSVEHRRVDISSVAVKHGSEKSPGLGYVIRGDGPTVFFCGKSGYSEGFASVGRRFRPDIAMLPISGYLPNSFREQHMSPLDALYAFEDLRSKIMIPIRYGSFALSYERLEDPMRWLQELVTERDLEDYVVSIEAGQSRVFVRPPQRGMSRGARFPEALAGHAPATEPGAGHAPATEPAAGDAPATKPSGAGGAHERGPHERGTHEREAHEREAEELASPGSEAQVQPSTRASSQAG